jgi:hypothetical protein
LSERSPSSSRRLRTKRGSPLSRPARLRNEHGRLAAGDRDDLRIPGCKRMVKRGYPRSRGGTFEGAWSGQCPRIPMCQGDGPLQGMPRARITGQERGACVPLLRAVPRAERTNHGIVLRGCPAEAHSSASRPDSTSHVLLRCEKADGPAGTGPDGPL